MLAEYPAGAWVQYEPRRATTPAPAPGCAFGSDVEPVYDFENADVILSLDADFLAAGPASLQYARAFADRAAALDSGRDRHEPALRGREPTPSITGAKADHRLPLRAAEIDAFAPRRRRRGSASPA